MDKFINKDGKVVIKIHDDGTEEFDAAHFRDGKPVIKEVSPEEKEDETNPKDNAET